MLRVKTNLRMKKNNKIGVIQESEEDTKDENVFKKSKKVINFYKSNE